jgi:Trypsin-co-occurring domain 1
MKPGIGKTEDGILVEIDMNELEAERCSASDQAKNIAVAYQGVQAVLTRIAQPFIDTYRVLSTNVELAEAEIKLGLAFEAEGGIILVKTKGSANLEITIKLRAVKPAGAPSDS